MQPYSPNLPASTEPTIHIDLTNRSDPTIIIKPTIIIFDLDNTIHSLYKKIRNTNTLDYDYSPLSISAKKFLSKETDEHFKYYETLDAEYYMQPIARKHFKKVFDKIYQIQKNEKIKNPDPDKNPIAVKVITRGDYKADEVKKAWDKFYGDNDNRFTTGDFPLEVFNRKSFGLHENALSWELRKEKLITELFPIWKEKMPRLEKSRVCIIDDDLETCQYVNAKFSSIYFPTTVESERLGFTFKKDVPAAFAAIHELIDTAVPGHNNMADIDVEKDFESDFESVNIDEIEPEESSYVRVSDCLIS